jgi:hypothetical protein
MTKKAAVEKLTKIWLARHQQLGEYQKTHGPQSWGECPSDPLASYHSGFIAGLQAAIKAIKEI